MPVLKGTRLQGSTFGYKSDPLFSYTTLLLPGVGTNGANNNVFVDASTNNFAITRNGNATQGTFSPFSQTGWSNYFDGNTDYLTVPANSGFDYGTSDFTIEGWFYFNSVSSSSIIAGTWAVSPNRGWFLYFDATLGITFTFSTTGSNAIDVSSSYTPSANTWNHIAVSRTGVNLYFFVNGVQRGSTYNISTSSIYANSQTLYIGNRGSQLDAFYYTGYISNFRIVKGTAVYTSAFNPPTAPLTAISGTSLLTCQSNRFRDASTNNLTITKNGDTSVVAFSPFAPTAEYTPSIHGGSGYFDGTGDYLVTSTNAAFAMSSGDFTVEAWVNVSSTTGYRYIFDFRDGSGAATNIYAYLNSGTMNLNVGVGTTDDSASGSITLGAWAHVALVRSGSTITVYINGVSTNSFSSSQNFSTSTAVTIGRRYTIEQYFIGYISNFRVVKGTAVYTANFTPPTSPVVTISNTSLLLNFTNAGVYDATGKNNLETVGDTKISTAQSKFGLASMAFDGTGDYLLSSTALSELIFLHNGTPWTIEGWFYTGSTSQQVILSTDGTSLSIGIYIAINDTTTRDIVAYIFRGVSGSWVGSVSPTNSWSLNTWTHFAVIQDSSKNLTIYINGVQVSTASGSSFSFSSANPSYPLAIGRAQQPTPGGYFNGYIQDLRVTKGIARYTANFTPQASYLPIR
jgi:hypothetical protein